MPAVMRTKMYDRAWRRVRVACATPLAQWRVHWTGHAARGGLHFGSTTTTAAQEAAVPAVIGVVLPLLLERRIGAVAAVAAAAAVPAVADMGRAPESPPAAPAARVPVAAGEPPPPPPPVPYAPCPPSPEGFNPGCPGGKTRVSSVAH